MSEDATLRNNDIGRRFVPWRPAAWMTVALAVVSLCGKRGVRGDVCVLSSGATEITIGEPTAVCLVMNSLVWEVSADIEGNSFYSQVLILPKADSFSRFSVAASWQNSDVDVDPVLATFGSNVGLHVESMGRYSFQKAYRRLDEGKTFSIFTAIIAVDNGEVTGISWDDGCHFCSSSQCEANTYDFEGNLTASAGSDCYWDDADCPESEGDGISSRCWLTVYVVWTGTDSKGNYFTSSSKRLSMYSGGSLDNYIDDIADTYRTI